MKDRVGTHFLSPRAAGRVGLWWKLREAGRMSPRGIHLPSGWAKAHCSWSHSQISENDHAEKLEIWVLKVMAVRGAGDLGLWGLV